MTPIKYWDSLQKLADHLTYVESNLRVMIMSPGGTGSLWVLVEGEADMYLYERMFVSPGAKVVKAGKVGGDGNIRGGIHAVKEVVGNILSLGLTKLIIGIVDRDWSTFNKNAILNLPANIFLTDHRDLEMTLLSVKQVRDLLTTEIIANMNPVYVRILGGGSWFPLVWYNCCNIAHYMGSLRIVASLFQLPRIVFRESLYWDNGSRIITQNWEHNLYYSALEQSNLTKLRFYILCWWTKVRYGLNKLPIYDVSRGHDFLHVLSTLLLDSGHFSEKWMTYFMANEISVAEIRKLKLYNSINGWMRNNSLSLLV